MLHDKEHYDLMAAFERCHPGRMDKEDKPLWSQGIIYQDGYVNDLFLAFRRGCAYANADALSDIRNLEASRDGYRDDARALHAALNRMVEMCERQKCPGSPQSDAEKEARAALTRTNALSGEGK